EIDRECRQWVIPRSRAKTGVEHLVPVTDRLLELLDALPRFAGSDLLFPAARGSNPISGFDWRKRQLDEAINQVRGERGAGLIAGWRLHDLRRTVATGLERMGVPLTVTEAVLGHTSGSKGGIVGVYQRHAYRDEKLRALEAWGRHVDGLLTPAPAAV